MHAQNNLKIADAYTISRLLSASALHIGLGIATSGVSLPFTLGLSCISSLSRSAYLQDAGDKNSGSSLHFDVLRDGYISGDHLLKKAVLAGAVMGAWQFVTRPVAYAAIVAGFVADMTGYATSAVRAAPALLERKDAESFSSVWQKNKPQKTLPVTNSLRDVFWKFGSISPSGTYIEKGGAQNIIDNSLLALNQDKQKYLRLPIR